MAREPRFDLVGIAQQLVRRGNDRQPCCAREVDISNVDTRHHRQALAEAAMRQGCAACLHVDDPPRAPAGDAR